MSSAAGAVLEESGIDGSPAIRTPHDWTDITHSHVVSSQR